MHQNEPQIGFRILGVGLALLLTGCAGPTTPFGGLNPWELLQQKLVSEKTALAEDLGDLAIKTDTPAPPKPALSRWELRKAAQDNSTAWVLLDPEQIDYVKPITLRIYIHDPANGGHRPKLKLTYDDWDLSAKIRDPSQWKKVSADDWEFQSQPIKFSPSRVGELKVSFRAHGNHLWVRTKLMEPQCKFALTQGDGDDSLIQQTGKFAVDHDLVNKIEELSKARVVNPNLLAGLIAQESSFNPRAVSSSKAIGLTQVTSAAESDILGVHPDFPRFPGLNSFSLLRLMTLVKMEEIGPEQEWRLDPEQSIKGGITYLSMVKESWAKFASNPDPGLTSLQRRPLTDQEIVWLTLASYNSGTTRVKRAYLQDPKHWLKDENLSEARIYVHKISSYCNNFSTSAAIATGD